MIILPSREIPKWILEHAVCKNPKYTDADILNLHHCVIEEEQRLLLEYHLALCENPFREEIRYCQHLQITRLKKRRHETIEALKKEMQGYPRLFTQTEERIYSIDKELVDEHLNLLCRHRVSARAIHFFLIQYKLSLRIDAMERELIDSFSFVENTSLYAIHEEITTLKMTREAIERWIGGAENTELASLASQNFR